MRLSNVARPRLPAGVVRQSLRLLIRPMVGPPVPVRAQRVWLEVMANLNRPRARVRRAGIEMDGVPGERVEGATEDDGPAIIYLHGGGYTVGSPRIYRALTGGLAVAARATVFALDYRLAPEHPYPAALEDVLTCYRWLIGRQQAPGRIAVAGDSAGGGLTLAAAIAIRDEHLPLPAALVLISPWADLTISGDSMERNARADVVLRRSWLAASAPDYCDGIPADDPRCSPLFADLAGLPPIRIQGGEDDIILSDGERLAERAREAGVSVEHQTYPDMPHVFELYPGVLAQAEAAIADIAAFLAAHWQ